MTQLPAAVPDATAPRRRARAADAPRRTAGDTARPHGHQQAALPREELRPAPGRKQGAGAAVREGCRAPWSPYGAEGPVRQHGARQPPPADAPRSPRGGACDGRITAHQTAAAATVRTVHPIGPDPTQLVETVEHRL
ncbi:hypothetical protein ABTY53_10285 [Streptomyces noursei]|uniref:hypothetical protein n=1 Tax=Streptomyces noursei TaxID=1971 RepID=UPI0033340F73